LVTGGAGFIGSHLTARLLAAGHEVVVLDNLSTGRRQNLERALAAGVRLLEVDITDARGVLDAVREAHPEVIFHLGAQIDVRRSVADPAWDAHVNVEGTINVLEAARVGDVARFVNTSTGGAIYGEGRVLPAPEDHPVAPEAGYGQSKFAAEGYCDLYRRLHGLDTVSLRYGNVYGPRQDPLGEAGVVAIFCGRRLAGQRPLVFGDGRQTRDYVYVGDVVRANLAAVEAGEGAYNIGRGVQTSVLDIVEELGALGDGSFQPEFAPERPGEVRHIALDPSRAREELGWEAEIGLSEGLELTLEAMGS
jgi:UDP-glucose 4-epimerase